MRTHTYTPKITNYTSKFVKILHDLNEISKQRSWFVRARKKERESDINADALHV